MSIIIHARNRTSKVCLDDRITQHCHWNVCLEISGVAKIYNPQFFNELQQQTSIDLENIVYYKNDTHYFVMTAKKHSLLDKGVILQDFPDAARLLARDNVNFTQLCNFACEATQFATKSSPSFTFQFAVSFIEVIAENVEVWRDRQGPTRSWHCSVHSGITMTFSRLFKLRLDVLLRF